MRAGDGRRERERHERRDGGMRANDAATTAAPSTSAISSPVNRVNLSMLSTFSRLRCRRQSWRRPLRKRVRLTLTSSEAVQKQGRCCWHGMRRGHDATPRHATPISRAHAHVEGDGATLRLWLSAAIHWRQSIRLPSPLTTSMSTSTYGTYYLQRHQSVSASVGSSETMLSSSGALASISVDVNAVIIACDCDRLLSSAYSPTMAVERVDVDVVVHGTWYPHLRRPYYSSRLPLATSNALVVIVVVVTVVVCARARD